MVAVPIILIILLGGVTYTKAADICKVVCESEVSSPLMRIVHKSGATETPYDGNGDALFLPINYTPTIDFYSKTNYQPPQDRLMKDARPPESMSTINSEISGRGLGAPTNANLQFIFYDIGEDNFSWKNIIGELSQRVDDGNGGYKYALIGDYDIKHMVNFSKTIPISINNGITQGDKFFPSHKLDYNFFNHADLNRDRRIDGLDFAILAQNWARDERAEPNDPNNTLGTYVGKEPNDLDAYSDINRDGVVDFKDFAIFAGKWFYDADAEN
jgi:hypothetical protein